jgi:hypothetical protein
MSKLEEIISSTIYDLTHLEINTIIKDEMSASKAPASPRLILQDLAKKYHFKLISLGEKYFQYIGTGEENAENLFRGEEKFMGSAYNSFKELSLRAKTANLRLTKDKNTTKEHLKEDEVNADIKMFQRIETISNDVRRILKIVDTIKGEPIGDEDTYKFDDPEIVNDFRTLNNEEAKKLELKLDLRQLMLFKKANDIGTEKVVLQTIIGIDGDVTTRIAHAFADNPVTFINNIHNEAIGISVKFWESLVNVVVKLGQTILSTITTKT